MKRRDQCSICFSWECRNLTYTPVDHLSRNLTNKGTRSLTFEALGVLEQVCVGMFHDEVKFDGLQQDPLQRHDL